MCYLKCKSKNENVKAEEYDGQPVNYTDFIFRSPKPTDKTDLFRYNFDMKKKKMKVGVLKWSPQFLSLPSTLSLLPPLSANLDQQQERQHQQLLTARERRQMRKERRESKPAYNWREEVEERLIVKAKKRYATWTEELNLDYLAELGQQWWIVRVSRVSGYYTAELLAESLAKKYPEIDFKVYIPSVQVKRKLKNGSLAVKPKPLFPGCVFLKCVMDKEMHDFIRECNGVGGFVGSKVGNTKRQINKPRPVSEDDMEAVFRQARDEQKKADQAFEEEEKKEQTFDPANMNIAFTDTELNSNFKESVIDSGPKSQTRKTSKSGNGKLLKVGSTVRVLSGTFAEFTGLVKKVSRKTGKATVGITLFGKETIVGVDISEIVVETK